MKFGVPVNDQNTPSSSCPNGRHGGWLQSCIIRIATTCARRSAVVVAIALAIGAVAAWYANRHIAIDTDTAKLIASDVPWRQREIAFDAAFPQRLDLIAVVVDAPTAEVAERSTAALTAALSRNTELFRSVRRPDAGPFFEREGLLFMPLNELDAALERVIAAQPLLAVVAADPTLHGLVSALRLMLEGARRDPAAWMSLAQPMSALADAFDAPLAGAPKLFSWRALLNGGSVDARELRRFILAQPVLDYGELQPGAKATKFIRATARDLGLTGERGVRVRLTGPVPLADEELATLRDGAAFDAALTGMAVLVLLWLAFRSSRVVCAVLLTLMVGLAITTALGLLVYDRFNLISVAFAVLFIGLGVDFGIQFCVAYRAQREHAADPAAAVAAAARNIGPSLALAAMSTALGFYAFAPTAYRGLAELGFIAGTGMLVAFAASITLLPALLSIMGVRPGTMPIANPRLTALDGLLARRRSWVVAVAIVLALLSIALIPRLVFDFNPLNLRSRSSESVDTLLDLARDPLTTPNTIDVLTPSLASAVALGERLARLPEVDHVVTLASFVPDDQPQKLAAIADAALLLDPVLNAESNVAPDDARTVQALGAAARVLDDARSYAPPPVAAPLARLGAALKHLAQRTPAERERASEMLMPGFRVVVDQLRAALGADPVTLQTLPADLIRDWVGADGRARVEVYPRGDVND
ncbi:MAG TPA: MMPL family transporter, partial [Casimicrobiaceae bacterium]|nr:MMPL family transporter [Casimicrobiaceae bacterium]